MMAIVVAGLGSAPIRRLQLTWGLVPKTDMESFKEMESILDTWVSIFIGQENYSTTTDCIISQCLILDFPQV